jgi:hypothetical protein
MEYKVKIFSYKSPVTLEKQVNKWLSANKKINVVGVQSFSNKSFLCTLITFTEPIVPKKDISKDELNKYIL